MLMKGWAQRGGCEGGRGPGVHVGTHQRGEMDCDTQLSVAREPSASLASERPQFAPSALPHRTSGGGACRGRAGGPGCGAATALPHSVLICSRCAWPSGSRSPGCRRIWNGLQTGLSRRRADPGMVHRSPTPRARGHTSPHWAVSGLRPHRLLVTSQLL